MLELIIALVPTLFAAAPAPIVAPAPAPAPTVESLQDELCEQDAWQGACGDGGICIFIVGEGGSCECTRTDPETGRCIWYVCGSNATGQEWGPIEVPAPEDPNACMSEPSA